jgi:FkbH-like protein
MKLNEALKLLAQARALAVGQRLTLACGMAPLHLKTFLEACYCQRFPAARCELESGLYGDLEGNVVRAAARVQSDVADVVAVVIEWGDLDPRLGLRSVGSWSGELYDEIVRDVTQRCERMAVALEGASRPIALCPPTIPSTITGSTAGSQASAFELALQHALAAFLLRIARNPHVLIVHPARLDALSPPHARHDPRMELAAGFPYRLPHASAIAELLIALLFPAAPKKALITDLDDTLWAGIAGEVGPDQVAWTLDAGAQLHGMYQSVLRQLADTGVMLGAATRSDPEVVRSALARSDLRVDGSRFFPVQASWGPKSASLDAILRTWNIAAQDAVFVDDSPHELAEVQRCHPQLECLLFPRDDPEQAVRFFATLRDLFGRRVITRDDALRGATLPLVAAFERDRASERDQAAFLRTLRPVVSFRDKQAIDEPRALQLLNKTNQFNLNGERIAEHALRSLLAQAQGFALEAAYSDRYGALGTVGVVAGQCEPDRVVVRHWVLSCRAFARRIEHRMLHAVIELAQGRPVELAFRKTARNAPLRLFLNELGIATEGDRPSRLVPETAYPLVRPEREPEREPEPPPEQEPPASDG